MTRNEVRVSDSNAEMLAIKAIAQALEQLDRDARRRVLHWAGDRFVNGEVLKLNDEADKFLETFTTTLQMITDAAVKAGVTRRHYTIVAERMIREATEAAESEASS
jgi:hypothetical protein